ncbi:DUF4397 domain-containing protein [Pedobacter sp. L105]|uniref:DUF4397 domain-containing protein n=1 Tax=Pedobacter sp. L105 TaxID=1641871 RepID=UPI00131B209A|nr:DUF4397 domain-containing protein [Pedobacter sp. L105]
MRFKFTPLSKNFRRSGVFLSLLGITVAFSSCVKNNDSYQAPQQVAALAITNASSNSTSLDFYLDNTSTRVNSNPLLYGQKIDYVRAYPGQRTGIVTNSNSSSVVYTNKFTLVAGDYHSLYIVDKGDSLNFLLVKDQFTTPPTHKAMVRFANLSPDSIAYSLELVGDTTAFTGKTFKTLTSFKPITPSSTYTINLRNTATNTIVATLTNVLLVDQTFYTIWAKGLANTTVAAQKTAIQVSQH